MAYFGSQRQFPDGHVLGNSGQGSNDPEGGLLQTARRFAGDSLEQAEPLLRGISAIATVTALLAYHAGLIYAKAPTHLSGKPWQGGNADYRAIPRICAARASRICLEKILHTTTQIHGDVPVLQPHERGIYICNHPTVNALPSLVRFITEQIAPHLVIVSKKENLYHPIVGPLVGIPLWLSGNGAFIDRANPTSAVESLKQACSTVLTPQSGILIFPDGTRPSPKKIAASIDKRRDMVPGIEKWLTQTCAPRSRGLYEIMLGTEHVPTRVINLTIGFNRDDLNILDAGDLMGATLHIKVEDVTAVIPRDEEGLRTWLNEDWKGKNEFLGSRK